MTIQEAKELYPGRKDYQFQPVGGIAVGDRVSWLDYHKESQEGNVVFFFRFTGTPPKPHDFKMNPDHTMARIHLDDGSHTSLEFWNISKTASSPEAQTTQP